MAMLCKAGLFIHIPKCAGMWVRQVVAAEISQEIEIGQVHGMPWELTGNGRVFAIVRHPAAWLRSFWAYRQNVGWYYNPADNHGWYPIVGMTQPYKSDDFEEFINNILTNKPGLVSTIYQLYYHPFITYFKITEMDKVVEYLGLPVEETMANHKPAHATANKPDMSPGVVKLIENSEPWAMETFGFSKIQ